MERRYILFFAGFLFVLNIFCWREVFVLASDRNLKVIFFDVGQGDSAFIETPQGHQIVIDGGPNSSLLEKLGENMAFWDRTIDLVILSHPEKDHMTGILSLLLRYKVDYFLWTGVAKNDAENKKLAELLGNAQNPPKNILSAALKIPAQKTKIITAEAGQEIRAGNVMIDTIYPFKNLYGQEMKNTSNDTGVVSRLVFGKNSFLFTGDISTVIEKELSGIKSDVLKVAHHGSKYSTSELFLENVMPKIAVISVGKDNSYGHPTPETLQRLKNYDIKTLRTDESGDIEIMSDGNNISFITK